MDTITIGTLNSDLGKEYAKMLRKGALIEIAEWCATAKDALVDGDKQQMDAAFYYDVECLLRKLSTFAEGR